MIKHVTLFLRCGAKGFLKGTHCKNSHNAQHHLRSQLIPAKPFHTENDNHFTENVEGSRTYKFHRFCKCHYNSSGGFTSALMSLVIICQQFGTSC